MEYLHSIGFNNAKDPDKELEDVYKQLNECSEEYLEYKVRNQSPVAKTLVNTPNRRDLEANDNEEVENDEEQGLLDEKRKTD